MSPARRLPLTKDRPGRPLGSSMISRTFNGLGVTCPGGWSVLAVSCDGKFSTRERFAARYLALSHAAGNARTPLFSRW